MSYIGRGLDKISNIEHLDTITFDGSSSYSLTKNSVAFTPNSAQSLIVSIDGVVQSDNFTVSGSTIDFGVAIPSTSTCDFIKHFGTGVAFTPADGTVGTSQIADGSVTLAKTDGNFGKVLQVVSATDGTTRSTTSTSYVTGSNTLSLNITPSSTSNKILLIVTAAFYYDSSTQWGKATIFRDGVNLIGSGSGNGFSTLYNGGSDIACQIAINYLDSPSSTSSLNYQLYFRTESSGTIYINPQNTLGSITAMEIAG